MAGWQDEAGMARRQPPTQSHKRQSGVVFGVVFGVDSVVDSGCRGDASAACGMIDEDGIKKMEKDINNSNTKAYSQLLLLFVRFSPSLCASQFIFLPSVPSVVPASCTP